MSQLVAMKSLLQREPAAGARYEDLLARMQYFDVKRHWTKRVMPHLSDPEFNRLLVRDFNKFTFGRWGKEFQPGMYPEEFESCDWRTSHRGPIRGFGSM